jgi:hypothetical protein
MIPIKEYYCNNTPSWEEIQEAHNMAVKEDCVVHLNWFVQYNGWNDRYIMKDTDIEKLNNSLRHIIYGI